MADDPSTSGHALEVFDRSRAEAIFISIDDDVGGTAIETTGQSTTMSPRQSLNITLNKQIRRFSREPSGFPLLS